MCHHYSRHSAQCQTCEAAKPSTRHCECTDAQQVAIVRLEQITGQPLFNPNPVPATVTHEVGSTAYDVGEAVEIAHEMAGKGRAR